MRHGHWGRWRNEHPTEQRLPKAPREARLPLNAVGYRPIVNPGHNVAGRVSGAPDPFPDTARRRQRRPPISNYRDPSASDKHKKPLRAAGTAARSDKAMRHSYGPFDS